MKVAFIIPSISAGGAERVVVRLANYLASVGIETVIFVEHDGDIDYGLLPLVLVRQLPSLDAENILCAVQQHKITVISDHYHWNLNHLLEMTKVAERGVKIVLSEHNSYFYPLFQVACEGNRKSLDLYYARPQLYKKFNAITTLTRYSAHLLTAEGLDRVTLMYNPVSYEADAMSPLSTTRILTVSSFVKPAKRIDRMFKAFAEVNRMYPGGKLRVVGALDYGRFEMYCRQSGVVRSSVEVTGLSKSVAEHYLVSSIFAMTSEIEGQPMVLLEAASHGLPQIVFDIPGIEDQVLDGETGYIVEPDDMRGFAERAVELLRDPAGRRRMGARAAEFVADRFGFERIGESWARLLEGVDETGGPPADMIWSPDRPEAKGMRADANIELNRWFQKVLRPSVVPIVSVVVPVYGTEEYLGRCLESLLAQTLKEIEIIVVNDASPGNAAEVVARFEQMDSRIVYCEHPRNRGLYQARSTGARIARGAFLAHVDSDDYVHPEFLRKLYETALVTGADIVECAAVEVSWDGERRPFSATEPGVLEQPALLDAYIDEKMRHVVWNKLYRRTAWDRAPLHMDEDRDFSITEDLLRNSPLFATARKYAFISHVLYYYIRRQSSVVTEGSFAKMLTKINDICYVYDKVEKLYKEIGVAESGLRKLRHRQTNDLSWYFERGYNPQEATSEDSLGRAFSAFGPIGAVAAKQSADVSRLREIERKFWPMAQQFEAMQEKIAHLQEAHAKAESGRLWEKARADALAATMPQSSQMEAPADILISDY